MKKAYIAPESKLFTINLKENIADSLFSDDQWGEDHINASAYISFTHGYDKCRDMYSGEIAVKEHYNTFAEYYNQLFEAVAETGNFQAYYKCFRYKSNV